jgi:hypothetical protein
MAWLGASDERRYEQLPVASCLLLVGQKSELMRPILDPFRPVVFALKYRPHGEAYLSPPNSNRQPATGNRQLPQQPEWPSSKPVSASRSGSRAQRSCAFWRC